MEGILWKWTNYWSGWQTRWFTLEDGILSYYMSRDEVGQGCKGSMKVSALEIIVSNIDSTRMDLVVPGDARRVMYLRAATSYDRQRWLVALGSSKACLTTAPLSTATSNGTTPVVLASGDSFRGKKVELRIYADLLMQQVHMVKEAAKSQDIQTMVEGTNLIAATCDTLVKNLEDYIELVSDDDKDDKSHLNDTGIDSFHNNTNNKLTKARRYNNSFEKKT
ncbi:pleckstrin homology domain-containing family A member 3 [Nilaparvata lugens]|uniref:pleckstrin homology domain-containing family A member 3 n=1 Tax=Nilaparvata lugens TaxID=108931 RepID=UPI00193CFCFB|nr:pleckstrin homology domain-containing family A member 3 [Nilaparvata lugens]